MLIPNPNFQTRNARPPAYGVARRGSVALPGRAGVGLGDIVQALRRRAWLCLTAAVVMAAIGFTIGKLRTPAYTAEGLMVIETSRLNIPELQTIQSERAADPWGGRSQAQVLTSRAVIEAVVRKLQLDQLPEFNPNLQPSLPERLAALPWMPVQLTELLQGLGQREPLPDEVVNARIIEQVGKGLSAQSEVQSYTIKLRFVGQDPVLASNIVNAAMTAYVTDQIGAKRDATSVAGRELKARLDAIDADLQRTRDEIRALESKETLVETGGTGTLSAQELLALRKDLRDAENARAATQSDLDQIASAMSAGRYNVLNDDLVTARLRSLWEAEAEMQRSIAETSSQYGAKHPRMVSLQRELARLRSEIEREVVGIRRDLERRIGSVRTREASLRTQIGRAEGQAASSAAGRASLSQLKTEAESKQTLYNLYRQRYEQTVANVDMFQPDARIVSAAAPPLDPSSVSATLQGAIGGFLGLLVSGAFVVMRRFNHDGIDSMDDAEQISGLPALGSIPAVSNRLWAPANLAEDVVSSPYAAAAETIRGIILRMQTADEKGEHPKVLLFTSAQPGDGKSSTAAATARIAAQDGLRCLLIEADFRRPTLSQLLRVRAPEIMLNDYLAGTHALDEAIVEDGRSGAHVLLSSPVSDITRRYLEQPRLEELVLWARAAYDLVIIDSPPVLRVFDPLVLSRLADATVLVISWRGVSRESVRTAIQRLDDVGARILGVVLSRLGAESSTDQYYGGYESKRSSRSGWKL